MLSILELAKGGIWYLPGGFLSNCGFLSGFLRVLAEFPFLDLLVVVSSIVTPVSPPKRGQCRVHRPDSRLPARPQDPPRWCKGFLPYGEDFRAHEATSSEHKNGLKESGKAYHRAR